MSWKSSYRPSEPLPKSTGETPYNLVYGFEAMASVEMVVMHRVKYFNEEKNNDERCLKLDLTNERRWALEDTQGKMCISTTWYYNRQVLACQFFVKENVFRRNKFAHQDKIQKLSPKWEEPYKVATIAHPNTYVLEDMQGTHRP